jgi:hypothetical protein
MDVHQILGEKRSQRPNVAGSQRLASQLLETPDLQFVTSHRSPRRREKAAAELDRNSGSSRTSANCSPARAGASAWEFVE